MSAVQALAWRDIQLASPNDVHVWLVNTEDFSAGDALAEFKQHLEEDEIVRLNAYRFAHDQHRFLVSRWLRHCVLSHYLQGASLDCPNATTNRQRINVRHSPQGKPRLTHFNADAFGFSMSHSHPYVVMTVSHRTAIGVDMELLPDDAVRPDAWFGIASSFFAPHEVDSIKRMPVERQYRHFLEYWTIKESVIKACGTTLHHALSEVICDMSADSVLATVPASRVERTYTDLEIDQIQVLGACLVTVSAASFEPSPPLRTSVFSLHEGLQCRPLHYERIRRTSRARGEA
ncbi:hypothetical protein GCM10008090_17600 [Arenicella chitinivorans]|uniref:4'-phosphopantetheinyl transferase domain-containing protein n=1 Tax=Arenicella chitinivorans TaxID=1329800 RepID=A0A918VMF9_9GAMM|nr:4'-phosphopantetheinyl transferase superfamily protein [Arenicella chitinivorans]GHA08232.1 hypothetical protein GCM10008090_17600 [Arenicella chitinivorans]